MFHREFTPHPDLADYVQVVWTMESDGEADKFPREQILPDGIVELVVHYREPFITHQVDGSSYVQPVTFAISQMKKCIEIESRGSIGFIAVRFFPWGAYHFFDTPIRTFLDGFVATEVLWKTHDHPLAEQVCSAGGYKARVNCVEQFLLARLEKHRRHDTATDDAIKLCRTERGRLTVHELAERVELSKKQLERRFLDSVGTTPKTFCRVSRFLDVCHHLEAYRNRTLTELTYECGYFDQAHCIKEFKEFSGFTPKQFFAKSNVAFADI